MYDKINSGIYKNSLEYPKRLGNIFKCPSCGAAIKDSQNFCMECGSNVSDYIGFAKEAYAMAKKAYDDESAQLHEQFKKDALEYCGYENHPKADLIYSRAWESGHSSGLYSVLQELEDLCGFLNEFSK